MSRRRVHPIANHRAEERLPTSSFGKMIHNYITNSHNPVAFNLQDQLKTCLAIPLVSAITLSATIPLTAISLILGNRRDYDRFFSVAENSFVSLIKSPFILLFAPIRAIYTKINGRNLEDVSITSNSSRITPTQEIPVELTADDTSIDLTADNASINLPADDDTREDQETAEWNRIEEEAAANAERRRNGTLSPAYYSQTPPISSSPAYGNPPPPYEEIIAPNTEENLPPSYESLSHTQITREEDTAPHPDTAPPNYEETQQSANLRSEVRRRSTDQAAANALQHHETSNPPLISRAN